MEAYQQVQNLSLIIQPGDSFFPIVDAINAAKQTIKMTIFRLDDPIVLDALSYAVARKVKVQALVAPASKGWTKRNKKLVDELCEARRRSQDGAVEKREREGKAVSLQDDDDR